MKVAIVLDPTYSELNRLVGEMPVWAIDSESNRAAATRLWDVRGSADANQGVTLFNVADEADAENNCIRIIGQVDLHHGVYSSGSEVSMLRVIGTQPSEAIRQEARCYGFEMFQITEDGFIALHPQ
jgi:hypothetical protein